MRKRRNPAILLVLALTLVLGACGGSNGADESGGDEQLQIAYIPHLTAHPVWLVAKEGFDQAAQEYGFEGMWRGSQTGDVQEIVQALDAAIAQGVDGIAVAAINPSAMTASINRAKEQGIPVVTVLADAPDSLRDGFVGSDVEEIGRLAAEGLVSATGGSGKVGVVLASLDLENQRQILDAFKQHIDGSGLEIVATEADNSDLAVSSQKIAAMLTAHPDLRAIVGLNANVPIAACQVFKERGITSEQVAMIGMDDLPESLACVEDGTITGLIAQNFFGAGYLPGRELVELADGQQVPEIANSGVALVTPDTIGSYEDEFRAITQQ